MISWILLVLSCFLGMAPWLFGYRDDSNAMGTSVILALVVGLVSAYKVIVKDSARWEYWITGIAGCATIFAPFVLGFATIAPAMWTTSLVGLQVYYLSLYKLFWHQRTSRQR